MNLEKITDHGIKCPKCKTLLNLFYGSEKSVVFDCPTGCRYDKTDLDEISDIIASGFDLKALKGEADKWPKRMIGVGTALEILSVWTIYWTFNNFTCMDGSIMKIFPILIGVGIVLDLIGFYWMLHNIKRINIDIYWIRGASETMSKK